MKISAINVLFDCEDTSRPRYLGLRDPISFLSDLKENLERAPVRNIPQFMLLSTVEYAFLRFEMVADNDEHHIEHVL